MAQELVYISYQVRLSVMQLVIFKLPKQNGRQTMFYLFFGHIL